MVYLNLRKYRSHWGVIARVMEKMGTLVQAQEKMCNVVAQLVLLYRSEIQVVTGEMFKVLTAFHHRAARRITGMTAKHEAGGEWVYPEV